MNGTITTTQPGSWVYVAATSDGGDTPDAVAPAATVAFSNDTTDDETLIAGVQSAATVTPGPVTLGWMVHSATSYAWAALEIVPPGITPVVPPAAPGPVWLRRFRHTQLSPSPSATSGPPLYPQQKPAGNRGTAPGPARTGRVAGNPGSPPWPVSRYTSPPIQAGVVWRRRFTHPQAVPVVPAAPGPYIPAPGPKRNPKWGPVDKVSKTGDTMSGRLVNTTAVTAGVAVLTDAPLILVDASRGLHFRVTLSGDRTLGNPVNGTDGQKITLEVIQDATGGWMLGFSSAYALSVVPSLTPGPGMRDFLGFIYIAATGIWYPVGVAQGF